RLPSWRLWITLNVSTLKTSVPCYLLRLEPTQPDIFALSLHDALPIYLQPPPDADARRFPRLDPRRRLSGLCDGAGPRTDRTLSTDRKSTRLNSSHVKTSYAVFCLKKKPTRMNFKGAKTMNLSYYQTQL